MNDALSASNLIRLAKRPLYIICTGGGAGMQDMLWSVPGISEVFCGAEFPYAKEATDTVLGFEPEKYVSPETAVDLAIASFLKVADRPGAVGLGLTASVASNRAHRGDHRVFVATISEGKCQLTSGRLVKGEGAEQREQDGALCDILGFGALMQALELNPGELFGYARTLSRLEEFKTSEASDLLTERFFARPLFTALGKRLPLSARSKGLILPGAFNPPHEGHHNIAAEASRALVTGFGTSVLDKTRVTYAVSQRTPHKGELSVPEMLRRARLLAGYDRMFTRGDPLFLDKAKQHPGSDFIVGVDAVLRLLDPSWGIDPIEQFKEFQALGTRFYVAGRTVDGTFKTLRDVPIPEAWRHLFREVPGHWDYSSSAIRAAS